jgi:hypothetical protein
MTRQFKFGDKVRCFPTPTSVGVVLSAVDEYGYVNVMFDDALEVEDFPVSGLELIPNSDTARLDWMILRDYPGDMNDEDRAFTLQTERENIDTFIRLDAEQQGAAA